MRFAPGFVGHPSKVFVTCRFAMSSLTAWKVVVKTLPQYDLISMFQGDAHPAVPKRNDAQHLTGKGFDVGLLVEKS